MLVVTNQGTVWISRQSGLASAGKTEENGNITVLALVGRGVKGEDVVLDRHLVEENGEDTLLHFTGILGTQDNHLLLGEVDCDGGTRGHTLSVSVGWERTSIVDGVIGLEVNELFPWWADEHVAHEESMVGTSADDSDSDSVLLIPSCISINNIDAVSGI